MALLFCYCMQPLRSGNGKKANALLIPQQIGIRKSNWRSLLSMVKDTFEDLGFLGKEWENSC